MEEKEALRLPDEAEYPKELTEGFELLERNAADAVDLLIQQFI